MHAAGGLDAQLFDALPQPLLVCDAQGAIVRSNLAARRRFGGRAAAALPLLGLCDGPAAQSALPAALDRALGEGQARCDGLPMDPSRSDLLMTRLGGAAAGAPVLVLVQLLDPAAECPNVIEALRAEKEAAVAASQAKSRFLSRMSHELRTPLNAVLGFTQLMRADIEAGEVQPEAQLSQLDFIEQAGWHLLTMIDNVLDLSRIQTGRLDLHFERLPVGPAIEEVLSLVDASARRRQLQVGCRIATSLPEVCADRARLRQVLLVVLGNGVKFNVEHGLLRVSADIAPGGDFVRIAVADGGPGIEPARHDGLFESLEQLGNNAAADGTGVSLSIARQLVLAMGGRLELDSAPGQGATFALLLPVATDPAPADGRR